MRQTVQLRQRRRGRNNAKVPRVAAEPGSEPVAEEEVVPERFEDALVETLAAVEIGDRQVEVINHTHNVRCQYPTSIH